MGMIRGLKPAPAFGGYVSLYHMYTYDIKPCRYYSLSRQKETLNLCTMMCLAQPKVQQGHRSS